MKSAPPLSRDKIWYLSQCQIFKNIPREEIQRLRSNMYNCKRGHTLTWHGKDHDVVYVIKEGSVKISAQQPGTNREAILAILGHGEMFGQTPLLDCDVRPCKAVALEDSIICEFHSAEIEEALMMNRELSQHITKMVGERLRRIESRVCNLLFKDSRQRVAYILLELLKDWGDSHVDGGSILKIRITHQDIADLSGLTRETVSVTLADFELDECIQTIGRKIIVLQPQMLQNIVDGRARVSTSAYA